MPVSVCLHIRQVYREQHVLAQLHVLARVPVLHREFLNGVALHLHKLLSVILVGYILHRHIRLLHYPHALLVSVMQVAHKLIPHRAVLVSAQKPSVSHGVKARSEEVVPRVLKEVCNKPLAVLPVIHAVHFFYAFTRRFLNSGLLAVHYDLYGAL